MPDPSLPQEAGGKPGAWVWPFVLAAALAGAEVLLRTGLNRADVMHVWYVFLYPVTMVCALTLGLRPTVLLVALGLGSVFVWRTGPVQSTAAYITSGATYATTMLVVAVASENARRAKTTAVEEVSRRAKAELQTAKAQAEHEAVLRLLGVHEATSQALAGTIPVGIWISHDSECRRITGNEESSRILQMESGRNLSVTAVDGESPAHFRVLRGGVEIPKTELPMQRASRGELVRGEDLEVVFRDGVRRAIRVSASTLRDRAGVPAGAVGVVVDVTEKKVVEAAARKGEERFRAMADHAPVLIWMSDENRACTWFNRPWLEFVGRTMEHELGDGWAKGVHAEDLGRCMEVYERSIEAREHFKVKYRLRRHDGAWRWMMDHGVPIWQDEKVVGYIGSCIDITEMELARQRLDLHVRELERTNRDLEDFAHIAAHDLKEPLRGIRLVASFLAEDFGGTLGEEGAKRVRSLQDLCARSQKLLDSLMEVAQVARQLPQVEACHVGELVNEAVQLLSGRISEAKAEVRLSPGTEVALVSCDRRRAVQVLMNLISNGIKYNESQSKLVEVGVMQSPDSEVVMFVRDNGIGIPAERSQDVFRLFKRLHARDAYGGGTGAGLAIVKRIVERHGGRIWLESVAGSGTTFYFTLESWSSAADLERDVVRL